MPLFSSLSTPKNKKQMPKVALYFLSWFYVAILFSPGIIERFAATITILERRKKKEVLNFRLVRAKKIKIKLLSHNEDEDLFCKKKIK